MIIFTDGSYSKKPNMGGMGAVILYKEKQISVGCYSKDCKDNNVAEIAAIAMAIRYIKNNKIIDSIKDKTVTIISDSTYAIRKLTTNGSIGRDKFEQKCIDYVRNFLIETNKKVSFLHTKGHVHDGTKLSFYNNIADNIAGEERLKGIQKEQNKIINKRRWKENY